MTWRMSGMGLNSDLVFLFYDPVNRKSCASLVFFSTGFSFKTTGLNPFLCAYRV